MATTSGQLSLKVRCRGSHKIKMMTNVVAEVNFIEEGKAGSRMALPFLCSRSSFDGI